MEKDNSPSEEKKIRLRFTILPEIEIQEEGTSTPAIGDRFNWEIDPFTYDFLVQKSKGIVSKYLEDHVYITIEELRNKLLNAFSILEKDYPNQENTRVVTIIPQDDGKKFIKLEISYHENKIKFKEVAE